MAPLFGSEMKKNQTKNNAITNRAIIIARNNLLRKNPDLVLNLDLELVLSTSSGDVILKTTGKNNY
jgi:hypothetical protein